MKHDPTTEEGREQLRKILERRKAKDSELIRRAKENPDDEPAGKLTSPNELDLRRDRKNNDD